MTGLYAHKHHMFNNSTRPYSYCEHLRPDMRMVQDWAEDETDYETAYYGKWHIGPPQDLFDSRFEHAHRPPYPGRTPAFATGHGHPNTRLGPLVQSFGGGKAGTLDVPMDEFPDVMVARYSTDFLRSRSGERPFLLYSSLPGPHSPWMVPEEWVSGTTPARFPTGQTGTTTSTQAHQPEEAADQREPQAGTGPGRDAEGPAVGVLLIPGASGRAGG